MILPAGPPSLLLASHRRTGGQEKGEVVTVNQPKWGASVSAPASWDAFEPEHLQVSLLRALHLTRQSASKHQISLHISDACEQPNDQNSCTS